MQWQKVFLISGGASVLGTIVFLIFGTAEEQPWNKYGKSTKKNDHEMQKLIAMPIIKYEDENIVKDEKIIDK